MNTADIHLHRSAVLTLMVQDGFGIDEVRAHLGAYSKEIFGSDTPTGRLRVAAVINQLEREQRP